MAGENNNKSIRSQLERLDTIVELLETHDIITEDNPAFIAICDIYAELEQITFNLHTLLG